MCHYSNTLRHGYRITAYRKSGSQCQRRQRGSAFQRRIFDAQHHGEARAYGKAGILPQRTQIQEDSVQAPEIPAAYKADVFGDAGKKAWARDTLDQAEGKVHLFQRRGMASAVHTAEGRHDHQEYPDLHEDPAGRNDPRH